MQKKKVVIDVAAIHADGLKVFAPVHDIEVVQNELAIATHGRGFWILDGLEVIRQLRDMRMNGDKLLKPDDTYKGPRYGSIPVYFYIDGEPGEASLTFEDAAGNEVITYSTTARRNRLRIDEGMNSFSWNRRYEGMVTVPGHPMWAASTAGLRLSMPMRRAV